MKTLEQICEEFADDHCRSYKHFRKMAREMDTTTGEQKRKQQRFVNRAVDYYTMASAVDICLRRWRNQGEDKGDDG